MQTGLFVTRASMVRWATSSGSSNGRIL